MTLCLKLGLLLVGGFLWLFPSPVKAVTLAEQTQNFGNQLNVWRAIQELGNNLSGTAGSFTFRVSTSKTNLEQFDFTAVNTKIYDKSTNTVAIPFGCVTNASDPLNGLTFQTQGIPSGYQDVTIDFSCHNFSFIPGQRYLILISNANQPNVGVGRILFSAAAYETSGNDYFTGGGVRYAFDNQSCDAASYVWDSQTANSGCNIFTTPKDDLYFILTNTSPPPKTPVIFIPGIGGSEFKASQDIIWSKDDGHGGIFSHAYGVNEKVWVNQDEAAKLGDDDYFDVLRLKADGVTSEADLALTGSLSPFGYGNIDSFFQSLGYIKGTDFFTFAYDWRKDIRSIKDSLDALVEQAKTASGKPKVNIIAHSMGGLVARYYISDSAKAANVNKLIGLGVPHLGAVEDLKALVYGLPLGKPVLKIFNVGISGSEVKDVFQNFPSAYQLLPTKYFFNFYDNSSLDQLYPFRDDRDIDNNKVTGELNFDQIKVLLGNLGHNILLFGFADPLHDLLSSFFESNNGVSLYNIVGSNQPTLGQIRETWLIQWPINLIPIRDEIFINGDGTVPLYSASLKSSSKDLSAGSTIYYTEQEHADLVRNTGTAMQTVKSILETLDLPVEVKTQKIDLEGTHTSLDDGELELSDDAGNHTGIKEDGEIETNIPETFYSTSGKTKHAFVKKKATKVKVKITRKTKSSDSPSKPSLKIRQYKQDKVAKTTLYKDIPISQTTTVNFDLDPNLETAPSLLVDSTTIQPTSEISGGPALDQIAPVTKIDKSGTNPVTITLTASDSESGVLKTEYSLDNGKTVQTYTGPFTISTIGKTILQVKAIDKLGNEEIPQEVVVEVSSSSSSSSTSSTSEVKSSNTSEVEGSVLGISIQNPAPSAKLIESQKEIINPKSSIFNNPFLSGLLMVSAGIVGLASLGLAFTFFKPTPK